MDINVDLMLHKVLGFFVKLVQIRFQMSMGIQTALEMSNLSLRRDIFPNIPLKIIDMG